MFFDLLARSGCKAAGSLTGAESPEQVPHPGAIHPSPPSPHHLLLNITISYSTNMENGNLNKTKCSRMVREMIPRHGSEAWHVVVFVAVVFVSSVRSSSGYHGLLHTQQHQQPTFSNFSNSSDSKVKVKVKGPNMCYIFEKHGIQG